MTAPVTAEDGGVSAMSLYTRPYPTAEELQETLEQMDDHELRRRVQELRQDVELLQEETAFLAGNVEQLRTRGTNVPTPAAATAVSGTEPTSALAESLTLVDDALNATGTEQLSTLPHATVRRGRSYYRRAVPDHPVPLYLGVEDKLGVLHKERDRLRGLEDKVEREAEHVRDVLTATVEEAVRRERELQLERRQFLRHMGLDENDDNDDGVVQADDLVHYLRHRAATQANYLDKLRGQCEAAEQDILRAQQQLRRRRAAGEAFHAIDFAQLRIENQQLGERIEKRNAELVELKGMSTRTVQSLNSLMDALNEMSSEQTRLRKEYKSRCEYLTRCAKEVVVADKSAAAAERRHATLKAQHEAVKVPKIEEYIAQRAELYELEKAMQNCLRKVEIAQGQVQVMRQQTRQLMQQRDAAVDYAESKKRRTAALPHTRHVAAPSQSTTSPGTTTTTLLPAIHGRSGRGLTTSHASLSEPAPRVHTAPPVDASAAREVVTGVAENVLDADRTDDTA